MKIELNVCYVNCWGWDGCLKLVKRNQWEHFTHLHIKCKLSVDFLWSYTIVVLKWFSVSLQCFFLCVWAFVTFCSLTFNSHQWPRQNYSIKTISNSLVMRIKTNIIQEIFSWPNTKFSESPRSSSERVKLLTSVRFVLINF